MPDKTEQFMTLLAQSQGQLYRYIRTLLPREQAVDDVMQDTLLILWRKFDEYQPGTNFGGWASRIAYFEVLKERSRKSRVQLLDDDVLERLALQLAEKTDDTESQRIILEGCLDKLTPEDRVLIEGRYTPEVKMTDVADQLNRPVNSVYKSVGRVRKQLFECVRAALAAEESGQ